MPQVALKSHGVIKASDSYSALGLTFWYLTVISLVATGYLIKWRCLGRGCAVRSETLQFCTPRLSSSYVVLWGGDTCWPLGARRLTKCTPTQQHLNSTFPPATHFILSFREPFSVLFNFINLSACLRCKRTQIRPHNPVLQDLFRPILDPSVAQGAAQIYFFFMYSRGVQILKCS